MAQKKADKLEKLREKLKENEQKRNALNDTIRKMKLQIAEEESKEFQSVLNEVELSFDEAINLLKQGQKQHLQSLDMPLNSYSTPIKPNQEDNNASI